jgi:hypothetical protein
MVSSPHRYSRQQILCGLRTIVDAEGLGDIPADEPFDLYGIEFFSEQITDVFGLRLTDADSAALHKLASIERKRFCKPRCLVTLNQLADFFVNRVPAVSFGPVEIAGVECAHAGAFLGVRDAARNIAGMPRFAPSTPIRSRLSRTQLASLWSRVRWASGNALPPLRSRWYDRAACLFVLTMMGLLGSGVAALFWGAFAALLHAASFCKLSWVLLSLAERFENPLPEGIETFEDLAVVIAESNVGRW